MTKRQIIDEILELNRSADPGFLADFAIDELECYLGQLHKVYPPKQVELKVSQTQAKDNIDLPMADAEIDEKFERVINGMIGQPQLKVVKPSNHNLGSLDMDSDKNWLF